MKPLSGRETTDAAHGGPWLLGFLSQDIEAWVPTLSLKFITNEGMAILHQRWISNHGGQEWRPVPHEGENGAVST